MNSWWNYYLRRLRNPTNVAWALSTRLLGQVPCAAHTVTSVAFPLFPEFLHLLRFDWYLPCSSRRVGPGANEIISVKDSWPYNVSDYNGTRCNTGWRSLKRRATSLFPWTLLCACPVEIDITSRVPSSVGDVDSRNRRAKVAAVLPSGGGYTTPSGCQRV